MWHSVSNCAGKIQVTGAKTKIKANFGKNCEVPNYFSVGVDNLGWGSYLPIVVTRFW